MLNDTDTLATLHQLRKWVSRSLDDFGTGYSSLSYLRRFPFDRIKSTSRRPRTGQRPDCMAIVRAVATLGSHLGMASPPRCRDAPTARTLERTAPG
jgi:predicted signal transduction protein with EAL and GGDEF domain